MARGVHGPGESAPIGVQHVVTKTMSALPSDRVYMPHRVTCDFSSCSSFMFMFQCKELRSRGRALANLATSRDLPATSHDLPATSRDLCVCVCV